MTRDNNQERERGDADDASSIILFLYVVCYQFIRFVQKHHSQREDELIGGDNV